MALHILLNFIGSPLLKQLYFAELALVFLCCALLPFSRIFFPLIFFFFVEGQGRILLEYAPFTRFIYDLLVTLVIIRLLASQKRLTPIKPFPNLLYWAIILHILWYVVSIFNPYSPTPLLGIVAGKTHLYPLLFFMAFINSKVLRDFDLLDEIASFVLYCCLLQASLAIYQFFMTETHLFNISYYYKVILGEEKGLRYMGINFRPPGTTFGAGAYSSYLFLCVILYYMRKRQGVIYSTLIVLTSLTSIVAIFFSGVRSSILKFVLMSAASMFFLLLINRRKERILIMLTLITFVVALIGLPNLSDMLFQNQTIIQEFNMMTPLERLISIFEFGETYSTSRITFGEFINVASRKILETPLGIGAGRASPAASVFAGEIRNLNFYDENYAWYYENFYMSLVIEFGFGMIFMLLVLLYLPIFCFYNAFKAIFHMRLTRAKIMFLSAGGMFVILLGNWAASGLVTLPESFIFWMCATIGISQYQAFEEEVAAHVPPEFSSADESGESEKDQPTKTMVEKTP
jgi:hypothetical protein